MQEDPSRFAAELERAKRIDGHANCLCSASRPKLVVRALGAGLILARWPNTGNEHDKDHCTFFEDERRSAPGVFDAADPFIPGPTGLNAKLDVSVTVRTSGPVPGGGSTARRAGTQRRSAGLLAFLEYLWEGANLHKWHGDRYRSCGTCFSRLSAQIDGGSINSKPMSGIVHVMEPFAEDRKAEIDARFQSFLGRVVRDKETRRRGSLLCEIKEFKPRKYGFQVLIRQSNLARLFMSQQLHDKLAASFAGAFSAIGDTSRRNAALLVLERSASGTLTLVDAAAMLLSRTYLPCDSSYEVALANRLVDESRRFTKPLRHVGDAATHPDFILNDVCPETVIEVYGMSGNVEYEARKLEKRRHYAASGVTCIEWEPTTTHLVIHILTGESRSRKSVFTFNDIERRL
ncbi:hypothetical protein LMG28138_05807 [Pararobbsia alpina]|uniref:DUF1173 domain-containing protein n=1 Tax=Pararobbsia alpina TaxID=621374 RepID=A0A6S7BWZ2_9BURK|nr:hypothetical protein LMG28138_05807 [Pararobbsia alpina]